MHSGMLDRMLSMVFPYIDTVPVCWCGLSPVWGLSPVVINSNNCLIGELLMLETYYLDYFVVMGF